MIAVLVMDWTGHTIRFVGSQRDAVIVQTGLKKNSIRAQYISYKFNKTKINK